MALIDLLGVTSRVETPFVKVTIGTYTFGIADVVTYKERYRDGSTQILRDVQFPNYIQSLKVKKINGKVNTYTLNFTYPITPSNDPNFFEKVFSSVSESRKIVFSYGDMSMPTFIYRDEEAIITKVKSKLTASSSTIGYEVTAVSSGALASAIPQEFSARPNTKPSDVIYELLENESLGLKEIFYGMRDLGLVRAYGLIPQEDAPQDLEKQSNMSVLDYLSYLVTMMVPVGNSVGNNGTRNSVYVINIIDDVSGIFRGPYFKISSSESTSEELGTYSIDVGYPSGNVVTAINIEDDEGYSIFYNYSQELTENNYTQRINDYGEIVEVFAPPIISGNDKYHATEDEKTWWTKVTAYPIKATVTLKGLLRPATLMSYVKLNIYFYGKKHVSSGMYLITSQTDEVSLTSGFKTTLALTRIKSTSMED